MSASLITHASNEGYDILDSADAFSSDEEKTHDEVQTLCNETNNITMGTQGGKNSSCLNLLPSKSPDHMTDVL